MLFRLGESVLLTPRVFDTLLYLVKNQGRVLEKGEMMRAIWPETRGRTCTSWIASKRPT